MKKSDDRETSRLFVPAYVLDNVRKTFPDQTDFERAILLSRFLDLLDLAGGPEMISAAAEKLAEG